jgi:hypothetical protein
VAFDRLVLEYRERAAEIIDHLRTFFSWQYAGHCVVYKQVFMRESLCVSAGRGVGQLNVPFGGIGDMALGGPNYNPFLLNVICASVSLTSRCRTRLCFWAGTNSCLAGFTLLCQELADVLVRRVGGWPRWRQPTSPKRSSSLAQRQQWIDQRRVKKPSTGLWDRLSQPGKDAAGERDGQGESLIGASLRGGSCSYPPRLQPSSIPTIQGLLLLGSRECACGNLSQGWMYTGMVSSYAFRGVSSVLISTSTRLSER